MKIYVIAHIRAGCGFLSNHTPQARLIPTAPSGGRQGDEL